MNPPSRMGKCSHFPDEASTTTFQLSRLQPKHKIHPLLVSLLRLTLPRCNRWHRDGTKMLISILTVTWPMRLKGLKMKRRLALRSGSLVSSRPSVYYISYSHLTIVGTDLKSKTSAGLDRIYGALEATGPITLKDALGQTGSQERLKAVLDKMQSPREALSSPEPAEAPFRALFDSPKASTSMASAVDLGRRLGTSTIQLASKTKDRLAPTVSAMATRVRQMAEMPARQIRGEDLEAGLRQLLFREPEAMEALEAIQVAACRAAIRVKRWAKTTGQQPAELFRDDPAACPMGPRLNALEGWRELERQAGVRFPEDIKARTLRVILLAEQSSNALLESFASLEHVPELLSPSLYNRLLLYTFRTLLADFTACSLELFAAMVEASEDITDEGVTRTCYSLLAELGIISALASIPQPDITLSFPELTDEEAEAAAAEVAKSLDASAMVSILREVYYAFEPIVISTIV